MSGDAIESVSGDLQDLRAWSSIGWREAAPEGMGGSCDRISAYLGIFLLDIAWVGILLDSVG